ncbi:hypothetical protein THAOC_25849, partial [Thalassiosira oceanica]
MFTCSGVEIEPRPFREPDPPYEESYLNRFQFDSGKPLFGGRDDGGSSCSTTAHSSCCEQSQLSGMGELDGDFGAGDTRGGIFVFDMNHLQEEPARTETIFGCDYDLPRLSHHEIDRRMQTETQELRDRAELMLQREQRQLRLSSKAAAVSASTVDAVCRSRMFEWALLVVSHSFPCQSGQISDPKGYTRQYSTEAIQIVTQAFALVDQIPCQIRNEYKLYCMVALHIVAKSSGLFSPSKERISEQQCSDRSRIGSASSSPKQSTSGGDPSDLRACAVTPEDEAHRPSRPALDLLSLEGLAGVEGERRHRAGLARLDDVPAPALPGLLRRERGRRARPAPARGGRGAPTDRAAGGIPPRAVPGRDRLVLRGHEAVRGGRRLPEGGGRYLSGLRGVRDEMTKSPPAGVQRRVFAAKFHEHHPALGGVDEGLPEPPGHLLLARDRHLQVPPVRVRLLARRAAEPGGDGVDRAGVRRARRHPQRRPGRAYHRRALPQDEPGGPAVRSYEPPGPELDPPEVPNDGAHDVGEALAPDGPEDGRAGRAGRLAVVRGAFRPGPG